MIPELQAIEDKYRRLTAELSDPAIAANPQKIRELAKERAELEPVYRKYQEWKRVRKDRDETRSLLADAAADPELRRLAEGEVETLGAREDALAAELRTLLLPKDPNDQKNVLLEIRAGAGGDEASLFAQDLFRMYSRFAERKGWKLEVVDTSLSPVGGIKEAIAEIRGAGAYALLKYESGVHRVQRVPRTEAAGRIHTSTATVAVLPEAEEIDLKIDPKDLKIEAFGSSGPGGQNVNRNYTAIRVTHKPSGLVVSCQDEKSQHRNKEKALRVLRSRLLDIAERERQAKIADHRRSQVGTGERSEKIRTYNFPQSRITDHRLNENFHNIEVVLDGALDEVLDHLIRQAQAQALGETASEGGQAKDVGR
ncbi:MAG TPA: peptide chain release factor 1 [Candidatus Aminicenantes bacterium]|nr:peptide chain release factor 1 [Candidatus Aminicenantes bacterium]HRY64443.1 peptide chain release factor 1 [Candidatus Aminicenantes bacterium]HRZ71356.1 peptide chain release factor 1 [Candidatus Aminicenantes bacterium]